MKVSMKRWSAILWIVRHGQSAGNVARDAAMDARLDRIALDARDVDIPLSPLGERQSLALGQWLAASPHQQAPKDRVDRAEPAMNQDQRRARPMAFIIKIDPVD